MNKLFETLEKFLGGFLAILVCAIVIIGIGVGVGCIFKNVWVGFFTIGGIIILWALWGLGVEIYQRITKTGVYEEKDTEK